MVYTRRKRKVRIVRSKRARKVWKKRYSRRVKRGVKRSARRGKTAAVGGILTPMRWAVMPYVDWQTYTLADNGLAQNPSSFIWNANSCYDPKWASTGTFNLKAAAFNFYSTFYNHWTVVSSEIIVNIKQTGLFSPTSTLVNLPPMVCILRTDDDASASTYNWLTAAVEPSATYRTLYWSAHNPTQVVTLRRKFSTRREYKNSKPWMTAELTGSGTTEPTEKTYFMLVLQAKSMTAGGVVYPPVSVNVRIRYKVLWTEPKDVDTLPSAMSIVQS